MERDTCRSIRNKKPPGRSCPFPMSKKSATKHCLERDEYPVQTLRKHEAHLRTLLETIPDLVWLKDPDGLYISCNPRFERFFGAKEAEIVGKTDYDFVDRDLADFFRKKDKEAMAAGHPLVNEEEVTYADDGHKELLETIKTPMYDTSGELIGILGIARDITERKRTERALKQSEERMQMILDVAKIGIWDWSIENDSWYASPIYYSMLGYEPVSEPADREEWLRRIHPDDRRDVIRKIRGILFHESNEYEYEARMQHADGTYRWHHVMGHVLERDAQDRPSRLTGVRVDITERKETELALAMRGRELEVLHRISEIALRDYPFELTLEKIVQVVTDALGFPIVAIEFYHQNREEMELVAISGASLPSNSSFLRVRVDQTPSGTVAVTGMPMVETSIKKRTEPEFEPLRELGVQTFLCVPMVAESTILGTLSMSSQEVIALTERSVAMAKSLANFIAFIIEHKRSRDERTRLESQLQQAQKMEAVGRLAGGVAHDFNNMLGVILGQTELLLSTADPDKPLFSALQEIRKAAKSSANLTRQLLAFARKQTIAPKVVDLNNVVESMIKMLQRIIGEDIHLIWLPGNNLWRVMVDPGQIDQILANLCVNARDAIEGVGRVTIQTSNSTFDERYCDEHPGFTSGEYVSLAIRDSGCGMDKQTLANIFEPFFTTKGMGKGTGLGLSTVYGIIKQHNGFIIVDSRPGKGSEFKLYFPRHAAGEELIKAERPERIIASGSGTILIAEDDESIANISTMMLKTQGYTVLTATSVDEAIRLAKTFEGSIDLLITDVIMPVMNGKDLARTLASFRPEMKILFMSGYTADVIAEHGVLEQGINFIQKPFSLQELADKVRKILTEESGKGA